MARVDTSVFMNRPVDEVFAFVTDLQNGKMWQAGFVESQQISQGPLSIGTTFRDVREFLGRRFVSEGEVIAYQPDRRFGLKVNLGPVPFTGIFDFESDEDGTKMIFVGEGEPGFFFKLLEPVVIWAFRKRMEENFATLKEVLEGPFWKAPGKA